MISVVSLPEKHKGIVLSPSDENCHQSLMKMNANTDLKLFHLIIPLTLVNSYLLSSVAASDTTDNRGVYSTILVDFIPNFTVYSANLPNQNYGDNPQ